MVILYGGSFNPPTIAHFEIAKKLIKNYNPKAFFFVPVGNAYEKKELIDFTHRYNMLQLFTRELEHTLISSFENEANGFKGTIYTLNYYQKLYPNEEIYYVIGADNLETFHTWVDYQDMIKKYKFIVLNRNQINIKEVLKKHPILLEYIDQLYIDDNFEQEVSSSDYRDQLNDEVVNDKINQYIYKHNLYNRGGKYEK